MNAADALEVFAEVSVGISGFSAIVVALAANTIIYDERRLLWGLGLLFGWALGALFFSVLPFIFFYFGMAEPVIWQIGLLAMGGYVAMAGTFALSFDRRLNRIGLDIKGRQREAPMKRSFHMVLAQVMYVVTTAMLLAAGVWLPIPGFYLVGMAIMLVFSLWVLLFIFFLSGLLARRTRGAVRRDQRLAGED